MTNKSENPREKLYRKMLHGHWVKIVSVLASVVVFITTYSLILPAITLSNQEPKCNIEEHTHVAECYDAEGNIVCGAEEHVHNLACYSDLNAAIESEEYWAAELPELTGDRNADVVAVAESQIGYKENDENYKVVDNEQTKGYTRYGHWYGDEIDTYSEKFENGLSDYAYKDWDAMFVSFVLRYAEIYDMGFDCDAGNWAGALGEAAIYVDAANYVPQMGDLIFFTPNVGENMRVGIVSGVNRGLFGNEIKSISVILGDSNNAVEEVKVAVSEYTEGDITFETIHGYGVLTPGYGEQPEVVAEQATPVENADAAAPAEEAAPEEVATAAPEGEAVAEAPEAEVVPVSLEENSEHLIGQAEENLETVEEASEGETSVALLDAGMSEDGSEIAMNWNMTARLPEAMLPAGSIIRIDTSTGKTHAMTVGQVFDWAQAAGVGIDNAAYVDNDNFEVTFIGDNGLLYSWADVQNMDAAAVTSFTGIHIKALNDIALAEDGAVFFDFSSTARVADANAGQNYYVSKVSVNGVSGAETYVYTNGEAETVDQNEVLRDAGLEEKPTEKTLSVKQSDYAITMTYGPEAEIPDEAKLYVKEIRQGTEEYNRYINDAKAALGIGEADAAELLGRFFDIKIMTKEGEFEPKAPVSVNVEYKKAIETADVSSVSAVHFSEEGAEPIAVESVDASESEDETAMVKGVEFSAESFSVYGVVYTVDFEYFDSITGQTYFYSLNGGESINLTELLVYLNVKSEEDVDEFVANQVENVEFSNPELVEVTHNGKILGFFGKEDWKLISLKAFDTEETLTITLVNGENVIVKVTDENSEVSPNNGISSLLTDVTLSGARMEGNTYVLYNEQAYGIKLHFKEENKENGQFPMSQSFTYQLPSGFMPTGSSTSGVFPVVLRGGEYAGRTVNLNYSVSSSGLITFQWDTTTDPEAFNQLKDGLYSQFEVDIDCTYNGTSGTKDFGNDITKDVEIRNGGNVTVNKKGNYNGKTNCIDYEVTVYSAGICRNVVVSDTVTGSNLTYNKDAVSSSSISGKEVPNPQSSDNGFTLTIPQMNDNETVTIKYSSGVILDSLTYQDDAWGTLDQTGNKVTVTNNGEPEGEKEISGKDFEHKITMSDIGKSGTTLETDENGHAKQEWTITANSNANVSMAGHTISDSIEGNIVPVRYDGDYILVSAYYANGSPAYEDKPIYWSQMTSTDTSWSWTVPTTGPDTQKLSYVIKYRTDADVSERLVPTNVKNKTESDNGGTAEQGVNVKPYGGGVTGRKKVVNTDIAANTITWEVSFDVPATGLDSAKIVDTLPTYTDNTTQATSVDNYIEGTLTVTPELEGNESYVVTSGTDSNGKEIITIEFFKTENEEVKTGLTGTGAKRRIRVQFQTEIDPDWKQAAIDKPTDQSALYHTNNAKIIVNEQEIETSAKTKIDGHEPGMNKLHGKQSEYIVNGNRLPAYPFVLTLQGINDDYFDENGNLFVDDTFNSKYLAYYPETQTNNTGDNELVGYIYGADEYKDISNGGDPIHNVLAVSENKVVSSPEEGKIRISINRENIPVDDDGNFYPYYYVYYYLTVKDPIALEKLTNALVASESGVYKFLNTATNKDFGTVTDEFEYEVDVIDKDILKPDGKDGKLNDFVYYENGNYMVDYKIDVNPNALELGDEEELTLTDDYVNIAVDYTTIKIQKEDAGSLVDVTEADGVSWVRKGNRVTYYLKNGVHYVITYTARITGVPDNSHNVTYSNRAEFFGVKETEEHTQNVNSAGTGDSPIYGIQVFKHTKMAGSEPLPGAVFKLYKYDIPENENSWQIRPTATTDEDQPGWEYVRDLTTDSEGIARTEMNDHIQRWTWYKLVETTAPTVNGQAYQKKDFAYVFWITDDGNARYQDYVYLNDDVVAIDNEPVLPEKVTVGVTKNWTNDNGDISKRKDITVRLFADGVPYDQWRNKDGEPLPARDDTVKVLPLKSDGTTDGYIWSELQSGPVYSVVEDSVPGYTTTYSPKNTQLGDTINIKNKYLPNKTYIHVEKDWSNKLAPNARPEDITVQLKRKVSANAEIRVVGNGGTIIEHFSVPVGSTIDIDFAGTVPSTSIKYGPPYTEENNWQGEPYTAYEGGDRPAWELYRGNSTDPNKLISSGEAANSLTTEFGHLVHIENVSVDATGLTLRFPANYMPSGGSIYDMSNLHLSQTPQVTVVGGGSATYVDDNSFNNENNYYTLSADNNWKIDIDRLVKEDDDGKYIYYIEEVGVNDNTETPDDAGFTVTYENNEGIAGGTGNEEQDTIVVTNAPQTVDVDFTKTWLNTATNSALNGLINDTSKLRIAIQLERWYLDENGIEQKIDDLYDPIILYGDNTTYQSQGYPETYEETTSQAHGSTWSAKFSELPKKGVYQGKTIEYIYKIVESRVFLSNEIDENGYDLIKLGLVHSSVESDGLASTAENTIPDTSLEVEKLWVDSDGNTITPPPGITVTVQLQRRQRDLSDDFEYSGEITMGEWSEYKNVTGKTILLQSDTWTGSFEDLPVYGWHKDESTGNLFSFLEYDYRVVETNVTINDEPADKHYSSAVEMQESGQNGKKAVITNTEVETTSYEVTKVWKDYDDTNQSWVKDITVILHKKADAETTYTYTVSEITGDGGVKTYVATSEDQGAPIANVTGNANDGYTIKWDVLDVGFEYWTTEEQVDGYKEPVYAKKISDNVFKETDDADNKLTKAGNEEYIINRPVDAVSLPNTGGVGTKHIYQIGFMLIAFATLLYTYLNRKNKVAMCSVRNKGLERYRNKRRGGGGL